MAARVGGPDGRRWNSAVRSAGVSRGTQVATTAGQPSSSMARVK